MTTIHTYAERIHGLQEQIDELKLQIKDELENAANDGFTPSALKKAIKVSKMDASAREKHNQTQMDFETYLQALDEGEAPAARKSKLAVVA